MRPSHAEREHTGPGSRTGPLDADEGWGVIDSADTPGGCFAPYFAVQMDGCRSLSAGQDVTFTYEPVHQDGYNYRATMIWPEPTEFHPDNSEPS